MSFTNVCFTAYQDAEPLWNPDLMAYLVYQRERGSKCGRLHWQGYCEFHRDLRLGPVQRALGIGKSHIEKRRGTQSEAIEYCSKERTRVEPTVEKGQRKADRAGNGKAKAVDKDAIYAEAIAEPDFDKAIQIIRTAMPSEYCRGFCNIRASLQYKIKRPVYNRQLEYGWKLPNGITRWLGEESHKMERARCLVVVGPTRLGKTAWARSLGHHLFWRGQVNLGEWDQTAKYIVIDDIPWKFIPQKKSLLTQMGDITVTDKYVKKLNVCNDKPAIVLLNEFDGFEEETSYWEANTTVVRLDTELFDRSQQALQAAEILTDLNEAFTQQN